MSNYIKIPLANDPARAVKAGTFGGSASGGGTIGPAAGTATASDVQDLTGGSGTGLKATVLQGANNDATLAAATITITDGGKDYKDGDVVTIPIIPADGQKTSATAAIELTLAKTDLVASSGSATNDFFYLPIDNVGAVVKDSATTCIVELKQSNASGTGADKVAKYTITMDNEPAIAELDLQADVAAAVMKAVGAENSQPEVKFTNNAECLSVILS